MEKDFFHRIQEGTMPEDASLRNRNDGIITADGWVYRVLQHKAPFVDWIDFVEQAQEFFMTMETCDEAIRQLIALTQGYGPVKDYIITFKVLIPLTGFNDYVLVAQFRKGLHPKLGYDVVRAGAPGDEDLKGWYTPTTEMARAFRDAKHYYGNQGERKEGKWGMTPYKPRSNTASTSKREETLETSKIKGEPTEVKIERCEGSFKCYNCQKEGHIAKHCREPKKEWSEWKGKQKARVVEVNWKEVFENVTEEDRKEMARAMGFVTNQ